MKIAGSDEIYHGEAAAIAEKSESSGLGEKGDRDSIWESAGVCRLW